MKNQVLIKKFIEIFKSENTNTFVTRIPEHGEWRELIENSKVHEQASHPQKVLERKAASLLVNTALNKNCILKKRPSGKPYIEDENLEISISHAWPYVAFCCSNKMRAGVDIQAIKSNIERVAPKFVNEYEQNLIAASLKKELLLSLIWSAKECLFKYYEKGNLLFIENLKITITPDLQSNTLIGEIIKEHEYYAVEMQFEIIEDYVLVYTTKEITLAK